MFPHRVSDCWTHDDVIKWKHFPRYLPFVRGIHWSPVNSPHKGQWSGALMFSLICALINDWVTNREAGDMSRHRAHYDVIVMTLLGLTPERTLKPRITGPLWVETTGDGWIPHTKVSLKRQTFPCHAVIMNTGNLPRLVVVRQSQYQCPVQDKGDVTTLNSAEWLCVHAQPSYRERPLL